MGSHDGTYRAVQWLSGRAASFSVATLAEALDVSPRQARRILAKLEPYGLVRWLAEGWWRSEIERRSPPCTLT